MAGRTATTRAANTQPAARCRRWCLSLNFRRACRINGARLVRLTSKCCRIAAPTLASKSGLTLAAFVGPESTPDQTFLVLAPSRDKIANNCDLVVRGSRIWWLRRVAAGSPRRMNMAALRRSVALRHIHRPHFRWHLFPEACGGGRATRIQDRQHQLDQAGPQPGHLCDFRGHPRAGLGPEDLYRPGRDGE